MQLNILVPFLWLLITKDILSNSLEIIFQKAELIREAR